MLYFICLESQKYHLKGKMLGLIVNGDGQF